MQQLWSYLSASFLYWPYFLWINAVTSDIFSEHQEPEKQLINDFIYRNPLIRLLDKWLYLQKLFDTLWYKNTLIQLWYTLISFQRMLCFRFMLILEDSLPKISTLMFESVLNNPLNLILSQCYYNNKVC